MAKANSRTTKFRQWLSDIIDPMPPIGDAWCMNCSLVGGMTAVIAASGLRLHVEAHSPGEHLNVKRREPAHVRAEDLEWEQGKDQEDDGR